MPKPILVCGRSARGEARAGHLGLLWSCQERDSRAPRASTIWTFNSRRANGGSISHRWVTKLPGSLSPTGPYAHRNPFPQANWWCSRSPATPLSFRQTVHRGSFSVPRRNIRTTLVLGHYSVHTTRRLFVAGESEIRRIGNQLVAAGLLRWQLKLTKLYKDTYETQLRAAAPGLGNHIGDRRIHYLQCGPGPHPPQLRGGPFRRRVHLARHVQEDHRHRHRSIRRPRREPSMS